MASESEMITAITKYHDPDAWKKPMVYSVWEDGEVTLEKGGDLFGLRSLHKIKYGDVSKAWPKELFPAQNTNHGRIFARSGDEAATFSDVILNS